MRRRITVVGSVCVCLLSHISPLERPFVLKILSSTQRATEVKKFVGFSLKPLHCRDPALPRQYVRSAIFLQKVRIHISSIYHAVVPRVLHFSAFIGLGRFAPLALNAEHSPIVIAEALKMSLVLHFLLLCVISCDEGCTAVFEEWVCGGVTPSLVVHSFCHLQGGYN